MKNILITGASGFIGQYLVKKLSEDYRIIGTDINLYTEKGIFKFYNGDIRNEKMLTNIFEQNSIDIVIHTAAGKSIPWCEKNPIESKDINLNASMKLYEISKKFNSHFIFVSSDIVFSGNESMYKIDSKKSPINNYGKYKDEFEEIIKQDSNVTICRTALVFGKIPKNQSIVKNEILEKQELVIQGFIVEQVIDRLKQSKQILLANDEFCSPTSNYQFYLQIKQIIKKRITGIIHCSGRERVSRFEFGLKIAKYFKLNEKLIIPIKHTDKLRPIDVSLDYKTSEKLLGIKFFTIDKMLEQLEEELK